MGAAEFFPGGIKMHVFSSKKLTTFSFSHRPQNTPYDIQGEVPLNSGGLAHRETGRFPGGPLLQKFFRAPGPYVHANLFHC